MAKNGDKDNINEGDAHGQESFESAGILLPKISEDDFKKESQRYRRPLKKSIDITIDDIIEDLDEAFNIALELEKPQPAAAVQAALGKAKLLGLLDGKDLSDDGESNKSIRLEIVGVKASNSNT